MGKAQAGPDSRTRSGPESFLEAVLFADHGFLGLGLEHQAEGHGRGDQGRHHAELDLYGDEVPAEGDWLTLYGELNVEWGGGA